MNDLLFYALLLALLYYFFYYLPQKKLSAHNQPLQHHQSTQTETNSTDTLNCPGMVKFPSGQFEVDPQVVKKLTEEKDNLQKDIQQKERTITGLNNSYTKLETKTKQQKEDSAKQIDKLKEQLTNQDKELTELKSTEKSLDELLKGIQNLNQEL